jgi:hypothetical protein
MGLQKYRSDRVGIVQNNGGIPVYVEWAGGPSLSLVRNCKIENNFLSPRTVYVQGEADTYNCLPAACCATVEGKRRTIKGYLYTDEAGEYMFYAFNVQSYMFPRTRS